MKKTTSFLFVLLCVFSFSQQLFSQQVSIQFQHKTGYVGVAIPLYVVFENISQEVEPKLPTIDGFTIYKQLSNRTSEQTTFIQGKVTTTRRTIFTFILTHQLDLIPTEDLVSGLATNAREDQRILAFAQGSHLLAATLQMQNSMAV